MENKLNLLSQCVELLKEQKIKEEEEYNLHKQCQNDNIKLIERKVKEGERIGVVCDNLYNLSKNCDIDLLSDQIELFDMFDAFEEKILEDEEAFLSKYSLDDVIFIYDEYL